MSFHKIQNNNIIKFRVKILISFFIFLFFILFSRLFYLQIINHEEYYKQSLRNSFKESKIAPNRGIITDRNNIIIADNSTRYDLWVQVQSLKKYSVNKDESVSLFLNQIGSIIDFSDYTINKLKNKLTYSNPYDKVLIKKNITIDELSSILVNKNYLPALDINAIKVRSYPSNGINSSLLGYVGNTTKKDLQGKPYAVMDSLVGKNGMEKVYDLNLYGEFGMEEIILDSSRSQVDISKRERSTNGYNIQTTIDLELQKLAVKLMGEYKGSIVAMDPNNGDLLAMISTPLYNPNLFAKGLNQKEYSDLQNTGALFNRAIYGQYPPASTVKPFVALGLLDGDWVDKDEVIWCGPYFQLPGQKQLYRDWKRSGHGKITIRDAISRSSDVFFYKTSYRSGYNYISDYLKLFGFGEKTGINLPYERSGLVPSSKWKEEIKDEAWYDGETLVNAIGQGFNLATPLQLAYGTGALANKGTLYIPNYILGKKAKIKRKINIREDDLDLVLGGMHDVVYSKYGTAKKIGKASPFQIAGKTGTAQVFSTRGVLFDNDKLKEELKDHALFIGFAPFDDPKIAVAVVVEHGELGSATAAPMAQKLIDLYLTKNYPEYSSLYSENSNEAD
jgi:penicillin-binding protein 2